MHQSTGTLLYGHDPRLGSKLSVQVDPEIGAFYRSLVPLSVRLKKPKWPQHISVIRNETVPRLDRWGRYDGLLVTFQYSPFVYCDATYYWLRVFCPTLMHVRRELGLPSLSDMARPPDMAACFHTTIGNLKP